jgi:LysM repeat protein
MVLILCALLPARAEAADGYVVQPGDTIEDIAWEFGVEVADLVALNELENPDLIITGQEILLPFEQESGTGGGLVSYVIQPGDNVFFIAGLFGIDVLELMEANGIERADEIILIGQEMVIPIALPTAEEPVPDPWTGDIHAPDIDPSDYETIRALIYEISAEWGWDPYLIMALAWQESGWQQDIVSWAGAEGVMQLMPETAADAGPYLLGREMNTRYDVRDNITLGVAYLDHLYGLTGDPYLALAAYYQGLYSVETDGVFGETDAYALNILSMRDLFATGVLP